MNDNKYISNKVSMNKEQVFRAIVTVEQWNHTQTVRIWSLTTHRCVKILHASTDEYIMSVSLQHGFIAYSFGVHILIYRINITELRLCTAQKLMETQEHRGRIESVQLLLLSDEDKQPSLVSTGHDGLIKYWDLKNVTSRHTFNAQNDNVVKINCIYADRTHIASVGDDCLTVRIWSLTTHRCVKILHASTDEYIMSVSLQHGFIAYSFGVHILIYRINITELRLYTAQKLMETQEHRGRIESVQLLLLSDEDKQPSLVSTGHDGLIKYWDLKNVTSRHTFNAQNDSVVKINCIYADRTHIASVGDDCLVKILDFATRPHQK
ncbi:unnamed protein product [Adineta steineri]|uniref:Uncharacterized protein n=1 Tax=Adineta steineri TaxID=433720 RepID=A0A814CA16_9BILA|nr:unnamed protein product [Adineta steineri]